MTEFEYLNSMRSPFERDSRKMSQDYLNVLIKFLEFARLTLHADVGGYAFFPRLRLYIRQNNGMYTFGSILVDVDLSKLIEEFSTVYNVLVFKND